MSNYTNYPIRTHSFAWQRIGLVLSLSLLATPITPAFAQTETDPQEEATQQTSITAQADAPQNSEANTATAENTSDEAADTTEEAGETEAAPATDETDSATNANQMEATASAPAATATTSNDAEIPAVTLLYKANEGSDTVKTATIEDGTITLPNAAELDINAPKDKEFVGWYEPTKETVHFYKPGDSLTLTQTQAEKLATENTPVTLYALWLDPDQLEDAELNVSKTPIYFTVSPTEGGTLSEDAAYVPDSKATVMDSIVADPTEGYEFAGWYKDGKKFSDDPILDPTDVEGAISDEDTPAAPAVVAARFVPTDETATNTDSDEDEAPDLSLWRDPYGKAATEGTLGSGEQSEEDPLSDATSLETNDTTSDTADDPKADDPEVLDQAAQSLEDPEFTTTTTPVSSEARDVQVTDPTNPTAESSSVSDTEKEANTSKTTTTTTTTGTKSSSTPYSSYSAYTSSSTPKYTSTYTGTSSTYKSSYTPTSSSTYKSSYTPTSSTYSSYSAARTAQLAQTSDALLPALLACVGVFAASVIGLCFMLFHRKSHK